MRQGIVANYSEDDVGCHIAEVNYERAIYAVLLVVHFFNVRFKLMSHFIFLLFISILKEPQHFCLFISVQYPKWILSIRFYTVERKGRNWWLKNGVSKLLMSRVDDDTWIFPVLVSWDFLLLCMGQCVQNMYAVCTCKVSILICCLILFHFSLIGWCHLRFKCSKAVIS